jgi:molecular chaperone DnaJ
MDAGTQSGKVLRLRGKGLPSVQGYATGDLFVHLHIYTPTQVSKEERETLEKLRDSENFDPQKAQQDKGFFSRMRDMFS